MENYLAILLELNICLSYDPAIPLLGNILKKYSAHVHHKINTRIFTAVLSIIAKNLKQPKCPSTIEKIETLV